MEIESDGIQSLVYFGHRRLPHSCFLLLRVTDPAGAKLWLKGILNDITLTPRRGREASFKPQGAVHVAFTCDGLKALGMPHEALETFSLEFQQGSAHKDRARILGDTGTSDPEHWVWGGPKTDPVHILLMLYAQTPGELEALVAAQRHRLQSESGIAQVAAEETTVARGDKEPFGFHDGISQPVVEGGRAEKDEQGDPAIRAGEFILGYPNEYEILPDTPTVLPSLDPDNLLPAATGDEARRDFGRNGSYLVFRKLAQDVAGFEKYFKDQAVRLYGKTDPELEHRLAAKCMGRWKSGAPLVLAHDKDDKALGENNKFQYAQEDKQGFYCPVGSHIRRSNPRDAITENRKESLEVARRHRIIRRGRPFRQTLPSGREEQGIFFICLNANLRRQFEFIQQTWINSPKFGGLYQDRDPIVGDNDGTYSMTIPHHPVREQLNNLPRFVTVRAGGYFFLPGRNALRFLSTMP